MLEPPAKLVAHRFDQLADQINDRVMPDEADVERYVGLEHLDPDSLRIRRWGDTSEVESTKLLFQRGDIIFGKRRVYQRKLAVADFEGICSAHAMVLRAKPESVLPEFLPFFMQSDLFMERALSISVGSLSPTINWKALAKEEFLLPPIQEQARLVILLEALAYTLEATTTLEEKTRAVEYAFIEAETQASLEVLRGPISEFCEFITDGDHNPPARQEKGIPYIVVNCLIDGKIDDQQCTYINSTDFDRVSRRYYPQGGDVLVSCVGSVGSVAVVPEGYVFAADRSIAVYRANKRFLLPQYMETILRSPRTQRYFDIVATGTAQKHLYLSDLRKQPIELPSVQRQSFLLEKIRQFEEAHQQIRARIQKIGQMYRTALSGMSAESS